MGPFWFDFSNHEGSTIELTLEKEEYGTVYRHP